LPVKARHVETAVVVAANPIQLGPASTAWLAVAAAVRAVTVVAAVVDLAAAMVVAAEVVAVAVATVAAMAAVDLSVAD
jgi:hypothetical protein